MVRSYSVITLAIFIASVHGYVQECRYDSDFCSCKMGELDRGVCWDMIPGNPGLCSRRFCKAGWTCACGARTHLCPVGSRTSNVVAAEDQDKPVAGCSQKKFTSCRRPELTLGSVKASFSEKGTLSNVCSQVAWWHNGRIVQVDQPEPNMSKENVREHMSTRSTHTLLELRPGDLLAFRFKAAAYHCFLGSIEMSVNGTRLTNTSPGVDIRYSRAFASDWFSPDFEPVLGTDENDPNLNAWLPERSETVDGIPITPGVDLWQPIDASNPDYKISDWYWRIQIPK
jgi:hypothetical protein